MPRLAPKRPVRLTSDTYRVGPPAMMAASPQPAAAARAAGTPVGCVRAPPSEYFVDQANCESNKPAGRLCVPRYINGVWDRYHPYAQDTLVCTGAYPPSIMPQMLNDASLVEASAWDSLDDMTLSLMMDGVVGSFNFSVGGQQHAVTFTQEDLVEELDKPLMYVYSKPFGTGRIRLALNLTSGHATVSFPYGGGPAVVTYALTNLGM